MKTDLKIGKLLSESTFWVTAGPCSTDSPELARETAIHAKNRGVISVRNSVYKPRTNLTAKDGTRVYQGAREEGLEWYKHAWEQGLIPASEVMNPKQAQAIKKIMGKNPNHKLFLWTGARLNVTEMIEETVSVFKGDERIIWGVKNPMAPDLDLWIGMAQAVIDGGIDRSRVVMIHRGFVTYDNIRNRLHRATPDWKLALDIKKETGFKMLFDPSHLSSDPALIEKHSIDAISFEHQGEKFDGMLIEVHPRPHESKTDPGITWEQFDKLMKLVNTHHKSA
jgi:chorismate mutase